MKKLFDVIVFDTETGRIESIPGKAMAYDDGRTNAVNRLATVLSRINHRYDAEIVDAGAYQVGQVYEG